MKRVDEPKTVGLTAQATEALRQLKESADERSGYSVDNAGIVERALIELLKREPKKRR